MLKINIKFQSAWVECRLTTEGSLSFQIDGATFEIGPNVPMVIDVFYIQGELVTRNLDGAIPRWANTTSWNAARTTIGLLREWGYVK